MTNNNYVETAIETVVVAPSVNREEILSHMIECSFVDPSEQGFRKVKETLTRIGIPSLDKVLFQSCHILHKAGKYYICHFKELYAMDGRVTNFSEDDISRRNRVVKMLVDWNLIKVDNKDYLKNLCHPKSVKILKHSDIVDSGWTLKPKYSIGGAKVKSHLTTEAA